VYLDIPLFGCVAFRSKTGKADRFEDEQTGVQSGGLLALGEFL